MKNNHYIYIQQNKKNTHTFKYLYLLYILHAHLKKSEPSPPTQQYQGEKLTTSPEKIPAKTTEKKTPKTPKNT